MYSGSVVFQTWQHHAKHQEYRCKCKAVHISLHQMSSVFRLSNWALNSAADALVAAWGAWNTKIDSTKLRKGKKLKSSVQRRNALSGGMLPVLSWEEHRAWDAVKSSYKFGFRRNGKLTINALLSKSCISLIFEVVCWSSESLAFPRETKILSKLFLRTWLARLGHFQPTVAARLSISKVQVERSFPRFTNRFWENDAPIVPSVYSPGFSVKTIASNSWCTCGELVPSWAPPAWRRDMGKRSTMVN